MISVRFEEFLSGEYDNKDEAHDLYVLKNEPRGVYVGISTRNVWERWFGIIGSHLVRNYYGEWFATSDVGRAVLKNMPASNDWVIELWTLQDCIDFLGDRFEKANKSLLTIRYVEPYMIRKLKPSLNVIYANYGESTEDPEM